MKRHPYYNQNEDPRKEIKIGAGYTLLILLAAMVLLILVAGFIN
jgi:hypothetical protein